MEPWDFQKRPRNVKPRQGLCYAKKACRLQAVHNHKAHEGVIIEDEKSQSGRDRVIAGSERNGDT